LLLRLFDPDLSRITTFARTGQGADLGPQALPTHYPPSVARAWEFDIIDDHRAHPLEADKPPAAMGARSSLRLPIRFDDQLIGGLGVMSFEVGKYSNADLSVARRLADHVAVALSHQNLAERLAEEARRAGELRARATSLELLDELLGALIDSGGLSGVFAHVSTIARKVLAHDAAALMVRLADGTRARLYASVGFPVPPGEIIDVPEELLRNPDWEFEIFDPAERNTPEYGRAAPTYAAIARLGFRAFLRVPIRLENQVAGALVFVSKAPSAFQPHDVVVARRIA